MSTTDPSDIPPERALDLEDRTPRSDTLPRVVVITGASRGLGAGIAARFAACGHAVGLCARHRPDLPDAAGGAGFTASVDITDPRAVTQFAEQVTDALGPIGIWVNNAGVLEPIGPLRGVDDAAVLDHVATNLTGVIWGSRWFARAVHDRAEPGLLVNISSGASRTPYPGWALYGAAKAAVDHLSRTLHLEEATSGLRVVSLAPGVVDTAMQALIRATPAEDFPSVERFHALKADDAFNSPAWVADRILELVPPGPLPDWVTGQEDPVAFRVPDQPR